MGRAPVSVVKRQREQAKRERQQVKAQKKAQRKTDKETGGPVDDMMQPEEMEEIQNS